MRLILAQSRGFCAGVVGALDIAEHARHVRNEIVHNRFVVEIEFRLEPELVATA